MPIVTDENGKTAIRVCGGTIVWDALTQPEKNDSGNIIYKLKVAIPAGNPAIAEVDRLAQQCLGQSRTFNGTLPPGAHWAIKPIGPGEFNDMFPGGYCINASTTRLPMVFNDQLQELKDPMTWMPLIYSGQSVDVLVDCWEYNNKSKGIATGLNGVCINLAANAQRQQFGSGGGINVASIFGGGAAQPMAQPAGQPMQQPMAQPMAQPAGQPMQQPMAQPAGQPMQQPMAQPAGQPMQQPMAQPAGQPMQQPMAQPAGQPMAQPSNPMDNAVAQQVVHDATMQAVAQHAAPVQNQQGQPLQQSTNFLPQ